MYTSACFEKVKNKNDVKQADSEEYDSKTPNASR
jgi:hypothetical protein